MPEKLEHKKIDPTECPRCHGHHTRTDSPGVVEETLYCEDCNYYYGIGHDGLPVYVQWHDDRGVHEVYDSDYLIRQEAKNLFVTLETIATKALSLTEIVQIARDTVAKAKGEQP